MGPATHYKQVFLPRPGKVNDHSFSSAAASKLSVQQPALCQWLQGIRSFLSIARSVATAWTCLDRGWPWIWKCREQRKYASTAGSILAERQLNFETIRLHEYARRRIYTSIDSGHLTNLTWFHSGDACKKPEKGSMEWQNGENKMGIACRT